MSSLATPSGKELPLGGLRQRFLDDENIVPEVDVESLRPGFTLTDRSAPTVPGPDILWIPSHETYLRRVERLAQGRESKPPASLPDGFPSSIQGSRVWSGAQLQTDTEDSFILHFDQTEMDEIHGSLATFKAQHPGQGPSLVGTDTFPLPNLAKKLAEVSETLHSGRGFVVLRGLDPKVYTQLDNVLIYVAICRHIGTRFGVQDSGGSHIIHVRDVGKQIPDSTLRQAPFSNITQPFHCDSCDVLAMYTLSKARIGGASMLASTGQIYNEIAKTRPDVIRTLAANNWIMDKPRNEQGKPAYWYTRPILFNFPQHGPGLYFNRRVLTGSPVSPRTPGVPQMSEEQAEALDMVHFTAMKHQLKITLEPGDILLANNFAVLHAREAYADDNCAEDENKKDGDSVAVRHLMRLWLRDDKRAWETPRELAASRLDTYGPSPRFSKAKWDVNVPLGRDRVLARAGSCS